MHLDRWLVVCGTLSFVALLLSGWLRRVPMSAPLVALGVGVVSGPDALRLLDPAATPQVIRIGSELLLAVSLMAVALRFPVRELRDVTTAVGWLLSVGTAAMAATVAVAGALVLGLHTWPAILLGVVLAPTDPVLASSVVTGAPAERSLPGRLRRLVSTESGANDGLVWPVALVAIAGVGGADLADAGIRAVYGVTVAVVVGVAMGAVAGRLLRRATRRREIETSAVFVATIALAVVLLAAVDLLGGDGVLAVFVGGLAYNAVVGREVFEEEAEVDDGIHRVLVLPLFVLLGASLPWDLWRREGLGALALFVGIVLVLRRLPVVLLLRRPLGLGRTDAVFVGWFGPIGVAAIYYLTTAGERGATDPTVWAAGVAVVVASTVAHGVTATPGRVLRERFARTGSSPDRTG